MYIAYIVPNKPLNKNYQKVLAFAGNHCQPDTIVVKYFNRFLLYYGNNGFRLMIRNRCVEIYFRSQSIWFILNFGRWHPGKLLSRI